MGIESFNGLIVGAGTFLVIGAFHPLVIKGEYYLGVRVCAWIFGICGAAAIAGSLLVDNIIGSAMLGVAGFSFLWSIHEVIEQRQRVAKGWFPKRKS